MAERPFRLSVFLFAALSFILLTTSACGSKQQYAEVSGVVLLDGKPMPDALVEFLPDPEKGTHGPVSGATTDAEGHFTLLSIVDDRDGVVVGSHRVMIQDARSIPPARSDFSIEKPPLNIPSRIQAIYGSAATTPLRQEVKPGSQTVTLEIAKNKPAK